MKVLALGIDAGFANMGFALVEIDTEKAGAAAIRPIELVLVQTTVEAKMKVRVSSDRLRRATELKTALAAMSGKARLAFAEIPGGNTQSASAAFALGIAVGVLASCPIPLIEVSPMEVKAAVAGKRVQKGATKAQIIEWAEKRWPAAGWRRAANKARTKNGELPAGRATTDNEHLADAMAAVLAGIATPSFRQTIAILSHAIPSTRDERPASGRRRIRPV